MTLARKKTKEEAAAAKASGLRYLRLVHHADEMAALLRVTARQLAEMRAEIELLLAKIEGRQ